MQQGKDIARDNNLGSEEPNEAAVVETMGELAQAEKELQAAMDGNDVFKQVYEKLKAQGLRNDQIYEALIQNGLTEDDLIPLAKYINANNKVQGMLDGTKNGIETNVSKRVTECTYRGTLNGEKQEKGNIVYVTDKNGRTLIVTSGDMAFDADGNPKEGVGDMLMCVDEATNTMDRVSVKDVKFAGTKSTEDYAAEYRQFLEAKNSQAYAEAAAAQGEGVAQDEGESKAQTETGKKQEGQLKQESPIINDGKGGTDNMGNTLNSDGSIHTESVKSISEITDEDFDAPSRSIELPAVPDNVSAALGANGKPVVIKKNIFEKNAQNHPELDAEDSRAILENALYNPNLVGQTQPVKRPSYKVAVQTGDKNSIVVLDVYNDKKQVEIVGWRLINEKGLEKNEKTSRTRGRAIPHTFSQRRVGSSPFYSSERLVFQRQR